MQNAADRGRFPPVNIESGRDYNELGTALKGHEGRHGRSNPELSRFIIAGGKHTSAVPGAADPDRFAAKCRPITDLDGGVKTVHVEVDNYPRRGLVLHKVICVGWRVPSTRRRGQEQLWDWSGRMARRG